MLGVGTEREEGEGREGENETEAKQSKCEPSNTSSTDKLNIIELI